MFEINEKLVKVQLRKMKWSGEWRLLTKAPVHGCENNSGTLIIHHDLKSLRKPSVKRQSLQVTQLELSL